jgi:hypothetical protein
MTNKDQAIKALSDDELNEVCGGQKGKPLGMNPDGSIWAGGIARRLGALDSRLERIAKLFF